MRVLLRRSRNLARRVMAAVARRMPVKPGNGAILLYHRIAALPDDPQLLSVDPATFEQQMRALKAFAHPMSLADLVAGAAAGTLPRYAVAVTFDDGYVDNLHIAKPILERLGIPATVFVATRFVEKQHEYWWDMIERLVLSPAPLPERLYIPAGDGAGGEWWTVPSEFTPATGWTVLDPHVPSPRHAFYLRLMPVVKLLPPADRDHVIAQLDCERNERENARETHRPMTVAEVRELARGGLITVGAHTQTHPCLARLSGEAQREEISGGLEKLRQWLGHDVQTFAYPYGTAADYDSQSMAALSEVRIGIGCSNFPGLVGPATDRHQLPRIIVRNIGARAFERQVKDAFRTLPR